MTNIFIVCHKHSEIIIEYVRPSTVTWDASFTSQLIFSMFCGYQNFAHSVAFILIQLLSILISGTSVYVVPSLTRIAYWAYYHCYHAEDMPSHFFVLIDKELCILQLNISTKTNYKKFIWQDQRHIHNPVKHLRCDFLGK